MTKRTVLSISALLLISLFFLSCSSVIDGDYSPPAYSTSDLVGIWIGENIFNDTTGNPINATVTINTDKSFYLTSNTLEPVSGVWILSGTTMIISELPNDEPNKEFTINLLGDTLVVIAEGIPLTLYRQ